MAYTYGVDVSHWQADDKGNSLVDWNKAYQEGIRFAFVKATNGVFLTRGLKSHIEGARDAGILTAPYHWLLFSQAQSAVNQARAFLTAIQNIPFDLPPVCDFEDLYNAQGAVWASAYLRGFTAYVESALGVPPMIYTGFYYWKDYGTKATWVLRHPLWLSAYGMLPKQREFPPTVSRRATADTLVPSPWAYGAFTFWQFTDIGNGWKYGHKEGDVLDLDVFNGSEAELRRRFGLASGEAVDVPDDALARLWAAHPQLHTS